MHDSCDIAKLIDPLSRGLQERLMVFEAWSNLTSMLFMISTSLKSYGVTKGISYGV
jgi:hypothetical protein